MTFICNSVHGVVFFAFFLFHIDKPTIWKNIQGLVPLFYGYSETLYCNASGYPKPTITWLFNNEQFSGENRTVNEPGEYTCVAVNSVGNDTKVIRVVTEGKNTLYYNLYHSTLKYFSLYVLYFTGYCLLIEF